MWRTDPFPVSDILHLPFGDGDALQVALSQNAGRIAAIIGEPIQGNGGVNVPPDDWWPRVRRLCDEHRTLLVFDEVQTGFNRTGRWFACEHWNVAPDLMAISKGLGNGFPIAAFMATEEVAQTFTKPSASTYGGNPVSAVAALATIDFHERFALGDRAAMLGRQFVAELEHIASRWPSLFDRPRGKGLMCGLPVQRAQADQAANLCDEILEHMKDLGVFAGKTGRHRNVLTFMPPLTITAPELQQVARIIDTAAARVAAQLE